MSVFKAAVKIAGGLYDEAAKLKRAKDQGFGEETFYHGTTADIKEFDNSKMGGLVEGIILVHLQNTQKSLFLTVWSTTHIWKT